MEQYGDALAAMRPAAKPRMAACRARIEEAWWRRDQIREPDYPEAHALCVRPRVEASRGSSCLVPIPSDRGAPIWKSIQNMAAVMDVDKAELALFERQMEDLGMLMTALGETHGAEIFGLGPRRFDLRSSTALDLRTGYDFNKEGGHSSSSNIHVAPPGTVKCPRLGSRAVALGPPGLHTTAREFHEKTPKRGKKERKIVAGEGKKARNFGLPPFGPP